MGDYVGDMTPQAKNGKNRPPGKGVKCEGQLGLFFIFLCNLSNGIISNDLE